MAALMRRTPKLLKKGRMKRQSWLRGMPSVWASSSAFRNKSSGSDIAVFTPWDGVGEIQWSTPSLPTADEREALESAWRGRGLTVERVLLDLHSGRLFALSGKVILDIVGIGMILLSIGALTTSLIGMFVGFKRLRFPARGFRQDPE